MDMDIYTHDIKWYTSYTYIKYIPHIPVVFFFFLCGKPNITRNGMLQTIQKWEFVLDS